MSAWRHYLLVSSFLLMVLGLCGRVIYLGVTERDFLQRQGDARSVRSETIPAMRGVIYDRHGEPLAVSTPVFAVWTDPSRAELSSQDIAAVADAVGTDASQLAQRLRNGAGREFVYLKRRASWEQAQALRLPGDDRPSLLLSTSWGNGEIRLRAGTSH